jgi:hypothetical protein
MLWVDMRRMTSTFSESGVNPLKFDKELLDIVWHNFVIGACFSRALEVRKKVVPNGSLRETKTHKNSSSSNLKKKSRVKVLIPKVTP